MLQDCDDGHLFFLATSLLLLSAPLFSTFLPPQPRASPLKSRPFFPPPRPRTQPILFLRHNKNFPFHFPPKVKDPQRVRPRGMAGEGCSLARTGSHTPPNGASNRKTDIRQSLPPPVSRQWPLAILTGIVLLSHRFRLIIHWNPSGSVSYRTWAWNGATMFVVTLSSCLRKAGCLPSCRSTRRPLGTILGEPWAPKILVP